MKLGFVSAIFPDLSLEEVIQFAAKERFSCVELMCWPKGKAVRRYAGVTHIDVTDFRKSDVAPIQDLLKQAGVNISALGYYPNPLAPDAQEARAYINHLKKVIKAAALLGVLLGAPELKYIGRNLAMILAVPYIFLGLAVVHALARRLSFPGTFLAVFYIVLVYFVLGNSGWLVVVLAAVGMIEDWTGLRVRLAEREDNQENE